MRHGTRLAVWLAAAIALMPAAAGAQGLNDPTRPPAGMLGSDSAALGTSSAPVLQSVIISPAGKAAIINGEMVRLGGTIGGARLVSVLESEVVLKEGGEEQVLKLYPGVEKSAAGEADSRRAAERAREAAKKAGGQVSAPGGSRR
ncbi:MAG: MSHA biogenesis protein MshK [Betaproteobacteria bacterium]|nr:MSHA biogenesis protein MshK [Betaproteobacteria bacterium]